MGLDDERHQCCIRPSANGNGIRPSADGNDKDMEFYFIICNPSIHLRSRQPDLHELEQRRDSGSFHHRGIPSVGNPSRRLFAWAPLVSFPQCWRWFIPPRIIFPTTAFSTIQGQDICRESPSFCWRVRLPPISYHTNRTKIHKCHFRQGIPSYKCFPSLAKSRVLTISSTNRDLWKANHEAMRFLNIQMRM